ncbi:MAG: DUF4856 domain-containing protein, partial [Myxococcaceae bacterium]|nr:DUF4856 domain-containing protein [Myxococcaceae bacterium]
MHRVLLSLFVLAVTACGPMDMRPDGGGTSGCTATLTGAYPDAGFATNAAAEISLLGRLNALNAPMRAAELDAGVTVTRTQLDELNTAGTPSLASLTAAAFQPVVSDTFTAFLASQGRVWTPMDPPMGGGIYGTGTNQWIFSERGVDLRQVIDKGLYGALFYAEAVKRMPTATTPESIDQLLALYGATPNFPQNDTTAPGRDELMAKYAKRRTPQGQAGQYTTLRDAFVRARAAAGSAECSAERTAALETIKTEWEKVLAATVVYYVNSAATKLQDPMADVTKKASAMHDLGEGASFFLGLKAVPQASRRITDAQIDQVVTAMKIPSLSGATAFQLLTMVPPDVDGILAANMQLQTIYGFTADE